MWTLIKCRWIVNDPIILLKTLLLILNISFFWLLGRGLFAKRNFDKGEFLCTYYGALLYKKEMTDIEKIYEKEHQGSYVFDFVYKGAKMW